ncbi:MAG: tetratricopeptide repeat protein [Pseudomonadota bacterium]
MRRPTIGSQIIKAFALAMLMLTSLGWSTHALADGLEDVRAGNNSFKRGQYERAVESFTRAIISGDLNTEELAVTMNNRGVAYGELGDFDRAMQDYEDSLNLSPKDEKTLKNMRVTLVRRGYGYFNLDDYQNARDDYNRAIEIGPEHYVAYLRRGELAIQEKRYDEAITDLEHAESIAPDERVISDLLTEARRRQQEDTAPPAAVASRETPPAGATTAATNQSQTGGSLGTTEATVNPSVTIQSDGQTASSPETVLNDQDVEPAAPPTSTPGSAADLSPSSSVASATSPSTTIEPSTTEPVSGERVANTAARPESDGGNADTRVRTTNAVNFRAGPGNDFARLGTVQAGAMMPSFGIELGWHEIEAPDGQRGYIYQRWLEVVE